MVMDKLGFNVDNVVNSALKLVKIEQPFTNIGPDGSMPPVRVCFWPRQAVALVCYSRW